MWERRVRKRRVRREGGRGWAVEGQVAVVVVVGVGVGEEKECRWGSEEGEIAIVMPAGDFVDWVVCLAAGWPPVAMSGSEKATVVRLGLAE